MTIKTESIYQHEYLEKPLLHDSTVLKCMDIKSTEETKSNMLQMFNKFKLA